LAIFISKCCVCKKIYNERFEPCKGRHYSEKVISHGFCSDACMVEVYGQEFMNRVKSTRVSKEGGV